MCATRELEGGDCAGVILWVLMLLVLSLSLFAIFMAVLRDYCPVLGYASLQVPCWCLTELLAQRCGFPTVTVMIIIMLSTSLLNALAVG